MLFLENCLWNRIGIMRKSCTLCHRASTEKIFRVPTCNFEKINFLCAKVACLRARNAISRELPKRSYGNCAQKLHTMPQSELGTFFRVLCYNFEKITFLCQMWLIWTHVNITSWPTKLRLLVLARFLKYSGPTRKTLSAYYPGPASLIWSYSRGY